MSIQLQIAPLYITKQNDILCEDFLFAKQINLTVCLFPSALFLAHDAKIHAIYRDFKMSLNKIEKTTKESIVEDALAALTVDCKSYKMMSILNDFIDFLKYNILGENCTILISGMGRLTPKIKKGGRPVRNPINGDEKFMPEIATVTLTKRFYPKTQQTRFTEKQLIKAFLERPSSLVNDKITSTALIVSFFNAIRKTSTSENIKLEIRGFGVFSSKLVDEKLSRNPKTNEIVIVDAHCKPHFKVSGNLKNELHSRLKNLSDII